MEKSKRRKFVEINLKPARTSHLSFILPVLLRGLSTVHYDIYGKTDEVGFTAKQNHDIRWEDDEVLD